MQAPVTKRNTELSLLILIAIIGAGALALVQIADEPDEVTGILPIAVVLIGVYILAHITVRKLAPRADPLVLPLAIVLNFLGVAAIYRLDPDGTGRTQVTWTLFGVALFVITLALLKDHRRLASYKYVLGSIGVGLLLLPLSPLGQTVFGARLWVGIGSFRFQPGELAKLALVVFFAAYLAERKELLAMASRKLGPLRLPDVKHFGPLLVMWGLSLAVMFFEKDLGSSLLFFSVFLVMIYIATARSIYIATGGVMFAVGAYLGYQTFTHVQDRVSIWLNVFDPKLIGDESYQLAQSLFAFATGGLFGTGLGQGRPDLIPAAQTDFIFAVLGEELGLLGTAAILLCFMLLVARGLYIAINARDDFSQLLAAGLTTILGIQTIIILGGVTRLLPLTGITLPFMSYGGSSLLSNFILIALLVRISHNNMAAPDPAQTAEILVGGR